MDPKFVVLADSSTSSLVVAKYREFCRSMANFLGEPVSLALHDSEIVQETRSRLDVLRDEEIIDPVSAAPMTSAQFVYREDGKPDWGAMWSSFCELALYGGPPHRGEDDPVEARDEPAATECAADMIWEMRRGIAETTGLYAKFYAPSWLSIMCESKKMAAWLCAAIILENVDAWCQDTLLFVPASADFELMNEVKSVITVVAKTFHYWEQHIINQGADEPLLIGWNTHFH